VKVFLGRLCTSVLVLSIGLPSFAAVEPLPPLQLQPKHPAIATNVTKLIAAIALFSFGSGPVRGFAVVLFFGVLTSMFTSVTMSRAMATWIYGGRKKLTSVSV